MTNLSSARLREETPHLSDALKRRAQSIINDKSMDGPTRTIIRYGFGNKRPLASGTRTLCRCRRKHHRQSVRSFKRGEDRKELTDLICCAGDEPSAALLVLLSTLENSTHPKALANTAKHLAFTRCGRSKRLRHGRCPDCSTRGRAVAGPTGRFPDVIFR